MYVPTDICVPLKELATLLQIALTLVPDHGPGSFMPEFPCVPTCFAGRRLANLGVRLVGIRPGAQIAGHRDTKPESFTRYHLPLQSNFDCWSLSGGVWQKLEVGRLYTMDPTEFHGAVNWGDTIRLHLIVDVA